MRKKYIFIILLFSVNFAFCKVPDRFPQKARKHFISVCALFKDEERYLKEWIEYHKLIGVDHFYLYNIGSSDRYILELAPYLRKGLITLIQWPNFNCDDPEMWALCTQIPAFENAIKFRAIGETKWLVLLNTDEYLVPVDYYSIKDLLKQCDSHPAIVLQTDVFDGSRVNLSPSTQMLIESRDLIKPPEINLHRAFTKIIFKPDLCQGFLRMPYQMLFKNNQQPIALKRADMRINRYANRGKGFIDSLKHKLYVDLKYMPISEFSALLDQGYAIEDPEQVIFRYIPDLRNRCIGGSQ